MASIVRGQSVLKPLGNVLPGQSKTCMTTDGISPVHYGVYLLINGACCRSVLWPALGKHLWGVANGYIPKTNTNGDIKQYPRMLLFCHRGAHLFIHIWG